MLIFFIQLSFCALRTLIVLNVFIKVNHINHMNPWFRQFTGCWYPPRKTYFSLLAISKICTGRNTNNSCCSYLSRGAQANACSSVRVNSNEQKKIPNGAVNKLTLLVKKVLTNLAALESVKHFQ